MKFLKFVAVASLVALSQQAKAVTLVNDTPAAAPFPDATTATLNGGTPVNCSTTPTAGKYECSFPDPTTTTTMNFVMTFTWNARKCTAPDAQGNQSCFGPGSASTPKTVPWTTPGASQAPGGLGVKFP